MKNSRVLTFVLASGVLSACATTSTPPAPQPAPEEPSVAPAPTPAPRPPAPVVTLQPDFVDEGLDCFRVQTPNATYTYHKAGAGFVSLIDKDGNDWIGHGPGEGPQGQYRGVPNMGMETFGHPGAAVTPGIVSTAESVSGTEVIIRSHSADKQWAVRWTITTGGAHLLVEKAPVPYWFLYEGTPGGTFDPETDYYVRGDREPTPIAASQKFEDELHGPEWIYFGDRQTKRVLLIVKHDEDCWPDRYFPMKGMAVFGFGRGDEVNAYLRGREAFTLRLLDTDDHNTIEAAAKTILGAP